jgi:hypothetical protein
MSKFSTWCNCSQIETTGRIWHMKEKEETYCVEKQYSVSWRVSFVRLSNPARWLWITISTYRLPLKWSSSQLAHPCAWMADNHHRQTHRGSVCGWTTECPRRLTCRHAPMPAVRSVNPCLRQWSVVPPVCGCTYMPLQQSCQRHVRRSVSPPMLCRAASDARCSGLDSL